MSWVTAMDPVRREAACRAHPEELTTANAVLAYAEATCSAVYPRLRWWLR